MSAAASLILDVFRQARASGLSLTLLIVTLVAAPPPVIEIGNSLADPPSGTSITTSVEPSARVQNPSRSG